MALGDITWQVNTTDKTVTASDTADDDSMLVLAFSDGSVEVYDTADYSQLYVYNPTTLIINDILFASNNTQLIIAADEPNISVINLTDGTLSAEYVGHTTLVDEIVLTDDETRLISYSNDDNTIKIWNTTDNTIVFNLQPHFEIINGIIVDKSGTYLYSISDDKQIKQTNISDGSEVNSSIFSYAIKSFDYLEDLEEFVLLMADNSVFITDKLFNIKYSQTLPTSFNEIFFDKGGNNYFCVGSSYYGIFDKESGVSRYSIEDVDSSPIGASSLSNNGSDFYLSFNYPSLITNCYKIIGKEDRVYIVDDQGIILNNNTDYLITPFNMGSIRHANQSQIMQVKFVNGTDISIQNVTITASAEATGVDLLMSKLESPFEGLQELSYAGPYASGAEQNFYLRLSSTSAAAFGEGSLDINISSDYQ